MFPVARILLDRAATLCGAMAREKWVCGSERGARPPFFFQKPTDAIPELAPDPRKRIDHPYPTGLTRIPLRRSSWSRRSARVDRDVRFGAARSEPGLSLQTVGGLDMTRGATCSGGWATRKKGPGEIGKSFDRSAVLGPLQPAPKGPGISRHPSAIWLPRSTGRVEARNANIDQIESGTSGPSRGKQTLSKAFGSPPWLATLSKWARPRKWGPVVKGGGT